ncbi:MAG: acetoacetate--CoA ligase [Nevskiaceae bacterium]|nr:MAG: acetoacetate--CoA ligase [Nevskiaceae bacterium]TBR72275.1 MAG: acetoacetate--CoA ligase [Nevskiaceae bacterium]
MTKNQPELLWQPSAERIAQAGVTRFQAWLKQHKGLEFKDYAALWQWSVDELQAFYAAVWEYFDVPHSVPYTRVLDSEKMPGAKWFEGARLNFAEQILRHHADDPERAAIIAQSEVRARHTVTWHELRARIASVAASLRDMGVQPGDRVVAYLPNVEEALIAFFATASVGAIWSSCSPDMGTRSVVERFRQIDPKVLIAVDGYRYAGKDYDRLPVVAKLAQELPTLEKVVLLPYLDPHAKLKGAVKWADLLGRDVPLRFEQVAFDHPLWVVYSSGTTGLPKPIVHGHGGVLIRGLQDIAFQLDVDADDRFMWLTTTGWIMWNIQLFAALVGATLCLYDGNPGYPDLNVLWKFMDETELTFFGAGAAYFMSCRKAGITPGQWMKKGVLKSIGSTGSPLPEEGFRWIMAQCPDAMIASISGGTDVAAAYVGGCPILPVYAGEIQCRYLGTAVYAFSDEGKPLDDEVGELVVTKPMPCMPLYFWNDAGGKRYHDSYFDTYPGVWRHGDWVRITPRGSVVIYGRSDTTINRNGVRMGTSELYRVVEEFPQVLDSLVVDLEYLGREPCMLLFVVLRQGTSLDAALVARIKAAIHDGLSPRHVPNEIIPVLAVPRTLSGKKMELPIKKLLLGQPLEKVVNRGAMANPDSLDWYLDFARRRAAAHPAG